MQSIEGRTPWNRIVVRSLGWAILLTVIVSILTDVIIAICLKTVARRPDNEAALYQSTYKIWDVTWLLENREEENPEIPYTYEELTEEMLLDAIRPDYDWVKARYDTMDFHAVRLYRFMRAVEDVIDDLSPSGKLKKKMDELFLGMKFWITENGDDSVCYYSENHEITFFALAYLIGNMYPDKVFKNDGRKGAVKAAEARTRIMTWLDLRGKYGFSEFYSHNYLPMDFSSLALLILYGDRGDPELMNKVKAGLDLLALDYALAYKNGTIIGAQGRAYARNNMNTAVSENYSDLIIDAIWNDFSLSRGKYYHGGGQVSNYLKLLCTTDQDGEPLYAVPDVIKKIGEDDSDQVVKTAFGLNLSDYSSQGITDKTERGLMFRLGSGALSNPEVINDTLDFIKKYDLWTNDFFSGFRYCNIHLFRWAGMISAFSDLFDIYPNGMALERSNVYAYKTKDYRLSTLVNYNPGQAGAQQTTMAAVLPGGVTVFTNHPLNTEIKQSPGFFAGYGVAPHAVQDGNVSMMIHKIPTYITLQPNMMRGYTHTYLPEELLDEVVVTGKYAFARKGNVVIALIGGSSFTYKTLNNKRLRATEGVLTNPKKRVELIQKGRDQYTCYEVSTIDEEGSFSSFISRIKGNYCSYNGKTLTYATRGRQLKLTYGGDFKVNGAKMNTDYKRYDTPFVSANYLSAEIALTYEDKQYRLNVCKGVRVTEKIVA